MLRPLPRVLTSMLVAFAVVMVALAVGSASSVPSAEAQDAAAEAPTGATAIDVDLHEALADADLIEEWLEASTVSEQASFMRVVTGSNYDTLRDDLLTGLVSLGRRKDTAAERLKRAQALEITIARLDGIAASLAMALDDHPLSAPAQLSPTVVRRATETLIDVDNPAHQLGFTLEPLAIAERHADVIAGELRMHLAVPSPGGDQRRQSVQSALGHLTALRSEIADARSLASSVLSEAQLEREAVEPAIAELISTFPELHRVRLFAPTLVDGLPLVTVDAYIRGAAELGSCPVDWSLLAGIGRVESRHGTLDAASIGATGRVSQAIYGPLLDGGATEREAEEAAALAEADVLAAELEAAAEEEAAARWLDPEIWGEVEELEAEMAIDPLWGTVEEDVVEVDPLYGDLYLLDPDRERLDTTADASEPADSEGDANSEQEEEEPQGNGFAVIVDTDNGRLDGNEQWDRAVGPMQFIPETWSYWGTDGNGDGVADPQNIYDAARSAGRFLCDLSERRGSSPSTFVLGYNASDTYVRNVLSFAASYGAADLSLPAAD